MKFKKLSLIFALLFLFTGCSKNESTNKKNITEKTATENNTVASKDKETFIFKDSLDREVNLPKEINKVCPSGPLAQIILYTIDPDKMISVGRKFSEEQLKWMDPKMKDLPETGGIFSGKRTIQPEEIIKLGPDCVIDIGEIKKNMKEDLDNFQNDTKVPSIMIEASIDTYPEAYRELGKLLGVEESAEKQAKYLENINDKAKNLRDSLKDEDMPGIYIAEGENGLKTEPEGISHAEIIEICGAKNVAVTPIEKGSGKKDVSLEQVILWNPDVILAENSKVKETILSDPAWSEITAVKNDKVYVIPEGPYNFLYHPPSVNRIPGIIWLSNLIHPEKNIFDHEKDIKEFYNLFYHHILTNDEFENLIK